MSISPVGGQSVQKGKAMEIGIPYVTTNFTEEIEITTCDQRGKLVEFDVGAGGER